jgi:uncharacterized protein (TIGR02594 family)
MHEITPYTIAKQYIGIKEVPGLLKNSPIIMAMLTLDNDWPKNDEVPWCSAFVNWIAWNAGCRRTKSLLARSWLGLANNIQIDGARQGWDVVVIARGDYKPGPQNVTAPGHVGFYVFHDDAHVWMLAGNQGNQISVKPFPRPDILGVRCLS